MLRSSCSYVDVIFVHLFFFGLIGCAYVWYRLRCIYLLKTCISLVYVEYALRMEDLRLLPTSDSGVSVV